MYKFSVTSDTYIRSCHKDLQIVAYAALLNDNCPYDFGITSGFRNSDAQFKLFKKGREYKNGKWVIKNKGQVVTYIDGYKKKSKHNEYPAMAFDIFVSINGAATWNIKYYKALGKHILNIAEKLFKEGKIRSMVTWGGNWTKFRDYPHFQI